MKIVLDSLPTEHQIALVKDVDSSRYYGVQLQGRNPYKGFITQRGPGGSFTILLMEGATHFNTYCAWDTYDLPTIILGIVQSGHVVWEFGTFKEMAAWLAE